METFMWIAGGILGLALILGALAAWIVAVFSIDGLDAWSGDDEDDGWG